MRKTSDTVKIASGAVALAATLHMAVTAAMPAVAPVEMPGDERLFAEAQRLSGLDCTKMRFAAHYCKAPEIIRITLDPGVAGQYPFDTAPRVVLIDHSIPAGSDDFQDTVVHEYTHYLQWVTGRLQPNMSCEQQVALERQAYAAGDAYAVSVGGTAPDRTGIWLHYAIMCAAEAAEAAAK